MSLSQFATFFDFDPKSIIGVKFNKKASSVTVLLEDEMTQTTGAFPQLAKGGKRIGGSKKTSTGRKTC